MNIEDFYSREKMPKSRREELIAAAGEQDRLLADMPAEHAAIAELVERDTLREIGTSHLRLLCAHGDLLASWKLLVATAAQPVQ